MSEQPAAPNASVAWGRVQQYLDKLFDAMADLDESGGVLATSAEQRWRPSRIDKAAGSMRAVRDQLDAELARIKAGRRRR